MKLWICDRHAPRALAPSKHIQQSEDWKQWQKDAKSIKKSQSHFDALWNFRYNDRNSCGPTSWQPRQLSCLILRELFCTSCHFLHIAGIADVLPTTVFLQVWTSQEQLLRGQIRNGCKGPWVSACQEISQLWVVRAGAKHIFSYLLWQGHETKLSLARHTRCQGLLAISSKPNFSSTSRSVARPSFASRLKNE